MTREEAIAYGNRVIEIGLNDETQAFCEIAIKALKQEPYKDCVSALNRVLEYTYGMLTAEKAGLQHLIKSMLDELGENR